MRNLLAFTHPLTAAYHGRVVNRYINLFSFFICLFFTSCWTYGLNIPSGLFVPSLACGAAYGRLVGQLVHTFKPSANVGVYSLVGAASFLGGVVRMTISLTVILVEATQTVIFSFPIMLALLCAKWVGDHFNVGIYDIHIHLKKIPMLEEKAEHIARRLLVTDVMTKDVVCLPSVVRLSSLVEILEDCSHNGFPVVEEYVIPVLRGTCHKIRLGLTRSGRPIFRFIDKEGNNKKRLVGVIIRYQIIVMLKRKIWGTKMRGGFTTQPKLQHKEFVKDYRWHRKENIEDVLNKCADFPSFSEQEELYMDLSPYMDKVRRSYDLCQLETCFWQADQVVLL